MPTLDEALAAFRRSRSAEITPLIIELGEAAGAAFTPPKERKNMAFHLAWLKTVETHPESLTWALSTLTTQLPKLMDGKEYAFGDQSDALAKRVEALEALNPDPRISTALIALADLSPHIVGFFDVMTAMGKALVKHADDATEAAVPEGFLQEDSDRDFDPAKLEWPKKATTSSAPAFRAKAKAPKSNEAELLQAVYDAPDADAPREVLSDFLQEHGDPRGEFIALQLREARGLASADEVARAQALVKQHGKTWLGGLRPALARAEMRRGFLWRIELAGSWSTKRWAEHAKDPMLSTVEALRTGTCVSKLVAPFLTSGAMKSLRIAPVGNQVLLDAVKASVLPRLDELSSLDPDSDDELAYLEGAKHIVALSWFNRVVGGRIKHWSPNLRNRLRRITAADTLTKASLFWSQLPALEVLTVGRALNIELRRDDERVVRATVLGAYGFADDWKGLAKSVKRIEIIGGKAYFERLRDSTLAKRKIELVLRSAPSGLITNPKG